MLVESEIETLVKLSVRRDTFEIVARRDGIGFKAKIGHGKFSPLESLGLFVDSETLGSNHNVALGLFREEGRAVGVAVPQPPIEIIRKGSAQILGSRAVKRAHRDVGLIGALVRDNVSTIEDG